MSVEPVAAELGLSFVEPLSGGAFGASVVTTPQGVRAVLKILPNDEFWSEDRVRHAVQVAEDLRQNGYPIPRCLDVGLAGNRVFTLQELINGGTPDRLRFEHAQSLIELLQRQVGAAEPNPSWAAELVDSIRVNDGEVQTLLRAVGTRRVLDLLDEVLAVGERVEPAIFNDNDVVHNDFGAHNILVLGPDVVAVIDWEGLRVGDSRADLMTIAGYAVPGNAEPGAIHLLEREIDSMPQDVRAGLAAHFTLSKLYFALRIGDDALLQWTLGRAEHWLRPRWRNLLNS